MPKTKNDSVKTQRTKIYNVFLRPETLTILRAYKQKVGVPVSTSIRKAVEIYVETLCNQDSRQ